MKKTISVVLLAVMLIGILTSCGIGVPSPEVTEGEFNVSVTYEANGETKTLDLVYLCEYDGAGMTVDGTSYRAWNGHFKGYEDGEIIEVCETDNGGKVALSFLVYPEYFMGEPDYADDFYPRALTNFIYYEDGIEMIDDDQTVIAEKYGVKVIDIEYDKPIENTFK